MRKLDFRGGGLIVLKGAGARGLFVNSRWAICVSRVAAIGADGTYPLIAKYWPQIK